MLLPVVRVQIAGTQYNPSGLLETREFGPIRMAIRDKLVDSWVEPQKAGKQTTVSGILFNLVN